MDLEAERVARSTPRLAANVDLIDNRNGMINLRGPVMRRSPLNRFFAWLLRLPYRAEVELDEIGTFMVKQFGDLSMESLAKVLAHHYKLTPREAQAALTVFVKSLLQRRLIILDGLIDQSTKAGQAA